jgi:hypothetical protein
LDKKTIQILCVHSGLASALLMCLGMFGVAGWLPVHDPSWGAARIAQIFQDDAVRIQVGMIILAMSGVLFWPFSAAISMQMKRIEGNDSHPLTYVQMASATGAVLAILLPAWLWMVMSYRPGAVAPETLQLANDFSWMTFVGLFPPALVQNVSIALCIFSDRSNTPIYPRWLGVANLVDAAGFLIPGVLLPFSKTGLFAWNGLIGFWLVAILFFGWIGTMWWTTLKALQAQR